jgi:hypothetical protein
VTLFYDAVTPAAIPAGANAVLYVDGLYAATPQQAKRFAAVRWNTVIGGAAIAARAGAADYEPGNPVYSTPGALRAWAAERHAMGCRARPYFDRADAARAWEQVHDLPNVFPWVATLTGREWRAEELADDLAANWGAPIPAERLWGNQFQGGLRAPYDVSVLLGTW